MTLKKKKKTNSLSSSTKKIVKSSSKNVAKHKKAKLQSKTTQPIAIRKPPSQSPSPLDDDTKGKMISIFSDEEEEDNSIRPTIFKPDSRNKTFVRSEKSASLTPFSSPGPNSRSSTSSTTILSGNSKHKSQKRLPTSTPNLSRRSSRAHSLPHHFESSGPISDSDPNRNISHISSGSSDRKNKRHKSVLPGFFMHPLESLEESLLLPTRALHHKFSDGHGKWVAPESLRKDKFEIVSFSKATPYQRTNPYITHGYRIFFSPWNALKSIFHLHNETLNIWTHGLAIPLFIYFAYIIIFHSITYSDVPPYHLSEESQHHWWWSITVQGYHAFFGKDKGSVLKHLSTPYAFPSLQEQNDPWHSWVFIVYFIGSISCFSFSSFFHTMCCVSEKVNNVCLKCDLTGIVLLIVVSFFPPLVYVFDCSHNYLTIYLSVISVSGIMVWCLLVLPLSRYIAKWKFGTDPEHAPEPVLLKIKSFNKLLRTISLIGLAFSGLIPAIHLSVILPPEDILESQKRLYGTGFCYLFGVFFYLSGFPERVFPGKFNFVLSSHQIWHMAVIAGAWFHLDSSLFFYHQWLIHKGQPDYCEHFKNQPWSGVKRFWNSK